MEFIIYEFLHVLSFYDKKVAVEQGENEYSLALQIQADSVRCQIKKTGKHHANHACY